MTNLADTLPRSLPAAYWALPADDLLAALGSGAAGLSTSEVRAGLRRAGALAPHHHRTELVLLFRQFATPITLILVLATLVSAALGEATDAAIILAIVFLSGLLSFWQEYAASRAVEALLASVRVSVEVWRDGARTHVPSHEVVAGDVVVCDTGDLVPGDCRLLDAQELLVDEAPLTGESYPVEKLPCELPADTPLPRRSNCLFMGTHVVRGSATAVVVQTGPTTEFGRIVQRLAQQAPSTAFERGVAHFGGLLLRVMLVLVAAIFAVNLLIARPFLESLLFSVAIAVGLTPQLLPAIVSVSLSLGARRMARARVIVKRLNAIEDFGGMDVLCTDKTGTLTQGLVRLEAAVDLEGNQSARVLECAYLNAYHHTGFANPIDDAVLSAGVVDTARTARLDELPYDFMRKRLSVLVGKLDGVFLVTKGAVEELLAVCTGVESSTGTAVPLVQAEAAVRARFVALSSQGYRVLGVAERALPPGNAIHLEDEAGMTFLGFLVFEDPPKAGITQTLRDLADLGISVRMVTGDNRLTAAHVASSVGLESGRALLGDAVREMSDEDLHRQVGEVSVFAEVDPVQKERIIRALRRAGHTVGYLGDGINDSPALHAADVGISVDTAVDVAKDAASIVLLEKDLNVLMQGVRLGRQTFANTLKYVFVTTSANFGNMASMAGATLFLPYLPLLPLQILLLNFLSDLPATTIAADAADPEQLRRPGTWDMRFIRDFMVIFGLISSVFDFLTFGVLRLVFEAPADLFRSGWFLESMATELAVMLVLRTRRPFFRSRPGAALMASSILVACAMLWLPFSPLASPLGFAPLPVPVLLALAGITAGYVTATELAKASFYRRRKDG